MSFVRSTQGCFFLLLFFGIAEGSCLSAVKVALGLRFAPEVKQWRTVSLDLGSGRVGLDMGVLDREAIPRRAVEVAPGVFRWLQRKVGVGMNLVTITLRPDLKVEKVVVVSAGEGLFSLSDRDLVENPSAYRLLIEGHVRNGRVVSLSPFVREDRVLNFDIPSGEIGWHDRGGEYRFFYDPRGRLERVERFAIAMETGRPPGERKTGRFQMRPIESVLVATRTDGSTVFSQVSPYRDGQLMTMAALIGAAHSRQWLESLNDATREEIGGSESPLGRPRENGEPFRRSEIVEFEEFIKRSALEVIGYFRMSGEERRSFLSSRKFSERDLWEAVEGIVGSPSRERFLATLILGLENNWDLSDLSPFDVLTTSARERMGNLTLNTKTRIMVPRDTLLEESKEIFTREEERVIEVSDRESGKKYPLWMLTRRKYESLGQESTDPSLLRVAIKKREYTRRLDVDPTKVEISEEQVLEARFRLDPTRRFNPELRNQITGNIHTILIRLESIVDSKSTQFERGSKETAVQFEKLRTEAGIPIVFSTDHFRIASLDPSDVLTQDYLDFLVFGLFENRFVGRPALNVDLLSTGQSIE